MPPVPSPTLPQVLAISAFGVAGVLLRFFLGRAILQRLGEGMIFPWGTFTINLLGSFLIGAVTILSVEKWITSEVLRLGLVVGFLGGFTTFSSFSMETYVLLTAGRIGLACLNVVGSVLLGLAGVALAIFLGRQFLP